MAESDLAQEVTEPTEDEVPHLQLLVLCEVLSLDRLTDFPEVQIISTRFIK